MKKLNFKRITTILIAILLAMAICIGIWQFVEYRKLLSVILPEDTPYQANTNLPDFVVEAVRQNRSVFLTRPSEEQLGAFETAVMPENLDKDEDAKTASEAFTSRNSSAMPPEYMTAEDIKIELDFLQRYMKYGMAGYTYFGGDKIFLPLIMEIERQAQEIAGEKGVETYLYTQLLQEKLMSIIEDQHSFIDGVNLLDISPEKEYENYYNESYYFTKSDAGFTTMLDGINYTVLTINGKAPDTYLRLSILEDGTFAHILWTYTNQDAIAQSIPCTLILTDNAGSQRQLLVHLKKTDEYAEIDPAYSLTAEDEYFFLRNSTLQFNQDKALKKMISDAGGLAQSKPVIMDLRKHAGGSDYYAMFWLMSYLNISKIQALNIPIPTVHYDLNTQTLDTLRKNKMSTSSKKIGLSLLYEGGNLLHIRNDTPIIVLVDRGTGSSGEWFLSYLRRMDNVIIVGENTGGLLIGGNTCTVYLPISRAKVTLSASISVDSDMQNYEWIGYKPDIYVPSAMASERVIAMIEKYDVER